MNYREIPVVFECEGDALVGIASVPPAPKSVGVLIIVGGPQYRVGSHRMFALLARTLAEQGYAAFRFDYRGMGDSSGGRRTFEDISADIACAAAAFRAQTPQVNQLVLWGLCDAASAALMSVDQLDDVVGLVLANPWVRSEQTHNQALVRYYYVNRLLGRDFWSKLFTGAIDIRSVLGEFVTRVSHVFRREAPTSEKAGEQFRDRMLKGWQSFRGRRLLVLSGQDLTAREFESLAATDSHWSLARADCLVSVCRIDDADHTFSIAIHRAAMVRATAAFLADLPSTRNATMSKGN